MNLTDLLSNTPSQTLIIGIVNVTPDSFSGDGLLQDEALYNSGEWLDAVVAQAERFVAQGAHILDVGGESTRPGAGPVDIDGELRRVIPAIEAIQTAVAVPISIDTYKSQVAAAALDAGAAMINDVWGGRFDPAILALAAKRDVPIVLMHNRSKPRDAVQEARLGGRYVGSHYNDLLIDITNELQALVDAAKAAGVRESQIILDPGIGFGKTVAQNLALLNHLDHFKQLGYPLLLGSSRKSFIGYTLDLPREERVEGTAATIVIGILRGAAIVRVHDVRTMARVARMTDAILDAQIA